MTAEPVQDTFDDARARGARPGRRWLAATALAVVVLAGGCGSKEPEQAAPSDPVGGLDAAPSAEGDIGPPVDGGALVYGLNAETSSLHPYVGQWNSSAYTMANAIYDPLTAVGEDGKVRPYLAESITSNEDFTVWTIGLRDGVLFHNGEPLDADAVVMNIQASKASALIGAGFVTMTDVHAVDEKTVEVTFSEPWSTFAAALTLQPGYMAAPAMLSAPDAATTPPIGTGPFKFEERVSGDETTVIKNEDYWQEGLPHLDSVVFKITTDTTSRGAALTSGDVAAIEVMDSALLKTMVDAEEAGEVQLFTTAGQETDESVIALNTTKAPFDDPVARQALAYAIDQETIAEQAYGGMYPAAWGNFEEDSPYFITREEAGYPDPDPTKASELATQYEQDNGEPLSFTFLAGSDPTLLSIAQYLQQTLSEVGIEMKIEAGESASIITRVITGDYQASTFGMWSTPNLDKGYPFVATDPVAVGISLNYTKLVDPELYAAMDEARATDDEAAQNEAWAKAQKRMATNLDRIFLVHPRYAIASSDAVHGFTKATFPGSDERAFNPTMVNPFLGAVWMSET